MKITTKVYGEKQFIFHVDFGDNRVMEVKCKPTGRDAKFKFLGDSLGSMQDMNDAGNLCQKVAKEDGYDLI